MSKASIHTVLSIPQLPSSELPAASGGLFHALPAAWAVPGFLSTTQQPLGKELLYPNSSSKVSGLHFIGQQRSHVHP